MGTTVAHKYRYLRTIIQICKAKKNCSEGRRGFKVLEIGIKQQFNSWALELETADNHVDPCQSDVR